MKKLLLTILVMAVITAIGYGVANAFAPQYGISSGLVGHWSMDTRHTRWTSGTTGTTIDMSGNNNTGTLTSMVKATSPVVGKIGQGLKFDGVDDRIAIPHNSNQLLTTGGTISVWVNPRGLGESNVGRIVVKENDTATSQGYDLRVGVSIVGNQPRTRFLIEGGTIISSADGAVPFNTWTLATVTWDASGLVTHYINGVLSGTPGLSGNPSGMTLTNELAIGNISGASTRTFDGSIDDVRVYNRALTAGEVMQLYRQGLMEGSR